jgi:hypothetical protein
MLPWNLQNVRPFMANFFPFWWGAEGQGAGDALGNGKAKLDSVLRHNVQPRGETLNPKP